VAKQRYLVGSGTSKLRSIQQAVDDGSANPLRFFADHLTAALALQAETYGKL
jgi:hypothetical protein